MLNLKQSDCRYGAVAFAAGEDLSLKTGYLAKLNAGGDLVLPQGAGEITPYVLTQGADQGYLCGAVPLTSAGNCRVKLAGTCEAGDLLVAKGDGRVEAGVPGSEALPIGTAEEKGVDGQHVLLRPLAYGARGEKGADGAQGLPGAQGVQGAQGPQGVQGPAGPAGGSGFALPSGSISGVPENPAELVGAVIASDYSSQWYGNTNQPVMAFQALAVVTGYADGVFECVLLSATGIAGCPSVVPAGCVGGMVAIGATCGVTGWQNNLLWLAVDGGTMYYSSQYKILAVGGGKVLLVSL